MISGRKALTLLGVFVAVWLVVRYVLPVALPFLLGGVVALAAEPGVRLAVRKARIPRGLAAGISVTAVLVAVLALFSVLGAFLVRELGVLVNALPDLRQTASDGILVVQDYLVTLANKSPEKVRPLLTDTVLSFFDDGTAVLDQVTQRLPGVVTGILGKIPNGVLGLGTGILAGFMISARLPKLKSTVSQLIPGPWKEKYLPVIRRVRHVLGGWLMAQLKLALITYAIVTAGFLLMGISYAPAWAALVAVVDAVPLLGTGTILVPCALVSLLSGLPGRAVSYLCLYGVAAGVRTVLEPRLVGRHLGIDPLLTLVAIYTGYRFWGFLGLLLAPMLASAAVQLADAGNPRNSP